MWKWMTSVGVVASVYWLVVAPAEAAVVLAMVAGLGGLTWLCFRAWVRALRARVSQTATAEESLARRSFATEGLLLSRRGDVLVALGAGGSVAICEFARKRVLLSTRIMRLEDIRVEALEDGAPLREGESVSRTIKGELRLLITRRSSRFELVVSHAVPEDDGVRRWDDYAHLRDFTAGWRDALAGKPWTLRHTPTSLLHLVSGRERNEALELLKKESAEKTLPKARLVGDAPPDA